MKTYDGYPIRYGGNRELGVKNYKFYKISPDFDVADCVQHTPARYKEYAVRSLIDYPEVLDRQDAFDVIVNSYTMAGYDLLRDADRLQDATYVYQINEVEMDTNALQDNDLQFAYKVVTEDSPNYKKVNEAVAERLPWLTTDDCDDLFDYAASQYEWLERIAAELEDWDCKEAIADVVQEYGCAGWKMLTVDTITRFADHDNSSAWLHLALLKGEEYASSTIRLMRLGTEPDFRRWEDVAEALKYTEIANTLEALAWFDSEEGYMTRVNKGVNVLSEKQQDWVSRAVEAGFSCEVVREVKDWPEEHREQFSRMATEDSDPVVMWYRITESDEIAESVAQHKETHTTLSHGANYRLVRCESTEWVERFSEQKCRASTVIAAQPMTLEQLCNDGVPDERTAIVQYICHEEFDWMSKIRILNPGNVAANLVKFPDYDSWSKYDSDCNECINYNYDWGSDDAYLHKAVLKFKAKHSVREALVDTIDEYSILKRLGRNTIELCWERIAIIFGNCYATPYFCDNVYNFEILKGILTDSTPAIPLSPDGASLPNPSWDEVHAAIKAGCGMDTIVKAFRNNCMLVGSHLVVYAVSSQTKKCYGLVCGKQIEKGTKTKVRKQGLTPAVPDAKVGDTVRVYSVYDTMYLPWSDTAVTYFRDIKI